MQLRFYQTDLCDRTKQAWDAGHKNVLIVSPTGSGKTVTMASLIQEVNGPTCAIAHRQELVSQISMALARAGVYHTIFGDKKIVQLCNRLHLEELGQSFFDPRASCAVVGVKSLVNKSKALSAWMQQVLMWVIDEAHHVLTENTWGAAVELFPNAKGLGVTATPLRTDGKGLGRHADGVFDTLIEGPSMGDLIAWGFLTPYRIFAPPSDLDLSTVKISKSGEFEHNSLTSATRKSHIMGDVVNHYLKIAPGKLGITFATDVVSAKELAEKFNEAGVPAAALDAKTPIEERIAVLRKFKQGHIKQLVNVDLFGEGFDLPAIEVVSMARATMSYGMYVQIFGRALRLLEGKEHSIIIDHVGNVERHGLPDSPRVWSLDRRDAKSKAADPNVIPVRACPECTRVYERVYAACPYCGHAPVPSARNHPQYVDGDLHELDEATLARLRGLAARVDMSAEEFKADCERRHVPFLGQLSQVKKHIHRQKAQERLRSAIAWWAGYRQTDGMGDSELYRRFFFRFGIDVLSAQSLREVEADALAIKIWEDLQ